MKITQKVFIVITLFIYLNPYILESQTNWTNHYDNPIIRDDFDPQAIFIHRPSVLYDGDSYHMWYTSVRVFLIAGDKTQLNCMGYATSPNGVAWQSVNPIAIQPSLVGNAFDMFHAGQGWVIADNDTFKMWYGGFNAFIGLASIGYAWSLDGSNWTRVRGPGVHGSVYDFNIAALPNNSGLGMPCVVKAGETYHMWYCQTVIWPTIYRIGYARSSDGIHWTKVNGSGQDGSVIDKGGAGSFNQLSSSWPAVIKTDEGFMMWYQGYDGTAFRIGCSISSDGIYWNATPGVDESGACFEGALETCVIPREIGYKMWYTPDSSNIINLAFSSYNTIVPRSDNHACPKTFTLGQNFPNPFNPSTKIEYTVKEPCLVNLVVYNFTGQILKELVNSYQKPGIYSITLNLQGIPSGLYLYKIRMGDFYHSTKKMVKIE